jgi:hypothetical protein
MMQDGLSFPSCTDGATPEITILAMGLVTNIEADTKVWGETLYIGSADAAFKAIALHRKLAPETLDASARGNGMIIYWQKGAGEVFTAATCEWVGGLISHDQQVITVTRNVLDRFGSSH